MPMVATSKKSVPRAKESTKKSVKKTFDFAKALEDLKKSKTLANTKKKLEVLYQEMKYWENTDQVLDKPADQIVQIGALLLNYEASEQLDFYKRILSEEFTGLRNKFDHYDLAYLYIYACTCFSRNALDESFLNSMFLKAQSHLEAVEIDKYGVEAALRLNGGYHRTRAYDFYRRRNFNLAYHHLSEATSYYQKVIEATRDPSIYERAQVVICDFLDLKIAMQIQQRQFINVLENSDALSRLQKFVNEYPVVWTRLFSCRGNWGVAQLSLGRFDEAIESFNEIEKLCHKHQPLSLAESDDLQLAQSYQCLTLSLMQKFEELDRKISKFESIGFLKATSKSAYQNYYVFLVRWALSIAALQNSNLTLAFEEFQRANELASRCKLQDFEEEWSWFVKILTESPKEKWQEMFKNISRPYFSSFN